MDFTTISKKVIEPGYLTIGAEPEKQIVGAYISRFRHPNFQHKLTIMSLFLGRLGGIVLLL